MTEDQIGDLAERVAAMSESERLELDPIAEALGVYHAKWQASRGWWMCPNRIVALAAVDMVSAWEATEWERE